jgi:hypothetical protein
VLRSALQSAFPVRTASRLKETGSCITPARREALARACAVCSLLPGGTEGRQLEELRQGVRMAVRQDDAVRRGIAALAGAVSQAGARVRARGQLAMERERDRTSSFPILAGWMLLLSVCTWANMLSGSEGKNTESWMALDWNKVLHKGEHWRLLTTFTTLPTSSPAAFLCNMFALLRLVWQKHYEVLNCFFIQTRQLKCRIYQVDVGSFRYVADIFIGASTLLLASYLHHGRESPTSADNTFSKGLESEILEALTFGGSGFLSASLILFMMVSYCFEKPMLFLLLGMQWQVESFLSPVSFFFN